MNSFSPTEDTIAAIATAVSPGQGSIAVIRISGSSAIEITKTIVHIPGKHDWSSHKVSKFIRKSSVKEACLVKPKQGIFCWMISEARICEPACKSNPATEVLAAFTDDRRAQ